jgi:hypothetical protein
MEELCVERASDPSATPSHASTFRQGARKRGFRPYRGSGERRNMEPAAG